MAANNVKAAKLSPFAAGNKMAAKAALTPVSPKCEIDVAVGVQIPLLKQKDNAKLLPVYAAALQRSAEDLLAAEDLDNIQLELETMLSNVALRYRVLKSEYESLDKDERRNERRAKHLQHAAEKPPVSPATSVTAATASTPGANAGASTASTNKRKHENLSVRKPKHAANPKHSKFSKNSPAAFHTDDSMDCASVSRDQHMPKLALPKNDTPNKFWLSVEPYCMPLTNEDLRLLDDLLEQYSGPLVPPIPELGPHYAGVWAAQDLKDLQLASAHSAKGLKQHNNNAANALLRKADSMIDDCVTGPLTQRLVSALMEEQMAPSVAELTVGGGGPGECSNSSSENTHSSSQLNFRSLSLLRNCISIERRVKEELLEQGILDLNDFPNHDEDEVHGEIKRLIAELSTIAEYNSAALKRLHESAAEEIKRLEIKRKLDAIDQEILETYKRTMQTKTKRKFLTQEEQQDIFRLTKEQKTLSDQLERAQRNCFLYE